jgi:ABC-type lipoprotein export system ATPase subunit
MTGDDERDHPMTIDQNRRQPVAIDLQGGDAAAPLYDLRGVTKTYGAGETLVRAVDRVDLRIASGELVVVAGPSGSGKTTLLQLLGALDRPTEGEVRFEGADLRGMSDGALARLRRETLGFVFQQFNLIPTLTAEQNIEVAMAPTGRPGADRHSRAKALLERVGLGHRLGNLPTQLSGGEQQRVAIARALANDPRVVLADEPTGNLDSTTGEEIMAILRELNDAGLSVVLITHDPSIAGAARRLIRMRDGRLLAAAESSEGATAAVAEQGGGR